MQDTKLIRLFKTFTKEEIKDFRDFIKSPYFNKNKNVVNLFESIRKYYPDFSAKTMKENVVYKKLFPEEKYDYFKLKNIMSDLYSAGIKYIEMTGRKYYSFFDRISLLAELRKRELIDAYEKNLQLTETELQSHKIRDDSAVYNNYLFTKEKLKFISATKPNTGINLVQEEFNSFFDYSMITLLKFYNLMLHEQRQNNIYYDMKMFNEVFSYLQKHDNESLPTFMVYKYIILLEIHKKEEYYFKLKELKKIHFDELSRNDMYMMYIHMGGFCAYMYNIKASMDFMKETFELYKEWLDKGFVKISKILYPDFVNFVKISLRVDEFEFVNKFINDYKDELPDEEKNNCLNFCYGLISYRKGKLTEALKLISKVNFHNFIMKLQVQILQLEIYFELGYYEQARTLIDTYKKYITKETTITEEYRETLINFLKLAGRLIEIKENPGSVEYHYNLNKTGQLVHKMKANPFGIKMWLIEQTGKLTPPR